MRVTWWGGPHDGQEIDVPDGTHHITVGEPLPPLDWRVDGGSPMFPDTVLRTRTFPISESDDGRTWFVWSER
jgi:hypothetical protein